MHNPELLLSDLNKALRELHAASQVLSAAKQIDEELQPVMRRLLLAETLSKSWIIAVGGTQSAGKTTLIRTMYDLADEQDAWLPPNRGRGEQLPILIEEHSSVTTPAGYLKKLVFNEETKRSNIKTVAVDAAEFHAACIDEKYNALLPVLRVPRRYFSTDNCAFLLLPGYEQASAQNQAWQDLMRQGLIGAGGRVIVTDSSRMASDTQQQMVRDMLVDELRHSRPLIAVAKTEGLAGDPQALETLRRSAAEAYQLEGEQAWQQVICTGLDNSNEAHPDYSKQWLPELRNALNRISLGGSELRHVQLARLTDTLQGDLNDVLATIRGHNLLFAQQKEGEDGAHHIIKHCLDAYDEACKDVLVEHEALVTNVLTNHWNLAYRDLNSKLSAEHEGLWNKVVSTFDTVSESQQKLEDSVTSAWNSPGKIMHSYTRQLSDLTMGQRSAEQLAAPASVLERLGYVNKEKQGIATLFTDERLQADLRDLMTGQAGDLSNAPDQLQRMESIIRKLPLMMLEFTRIAAVLSELTPQKAGSAGVVPEGDLGQALNNVKQEFDKFTDVSKSLVKGMAAILAIDVAADGQIDSIPALLTAFGLGSTETAATTTATGAGAAAFSVGHAVAAAVAIAYLVHSAMREVRRYDGQVRNVAVGMLQNTHAHHVTHFQSHYTELMRRLRNLLKQALHRRHGLDLRMGEQDRLAKALADVRVLRRDLLTQLLASGDTLSLLPSDRAA